MRKKVLLFLADMPPALMLLAVIAISICVTRIVCPDFHFPTDWNATYYSARGNYYTHYYDLPLAFFLIFGLAWASVKYKKWKSKKR
jgi:hypothetical protein